MGNPLARALSEAARLKQLTLNFTHRTAHGGDGDCEGVIGKFKALAD